MVMVVVLLAGRKASGSTTCVRAIGGNAAQGNPHLGIKHTSSGRLAELLEEGGAGVFDQLFESAIFHFLWTKEGVLLSKCFFVSCVGSVVVPGALLC